MTGTTLVIGGGAALGAGVAAGYLWPQLLRGPSVARLCALCRRRRAVALTYDDGPGKELTPRVLRVLAEAGGVKATFFMLGFRARDNPDIANRVKQEGHEVACHGDAHLHAWKSPPWAIWKDISAGYRALERWVPANGRFRPPYGKLTLAGWWNLRRRGAPVDWWTIDSRDTKPVLPRAREIVEEVVRRQGGVVLLHDFDRQTRDAQERAGFVLEVTDLLTRRARSEGLSMMPLSRLMSENEAAHG